MLYSEALLYMKKAYNRGSHLGLERMQELMEHLNHPEKKTPAIHIAGSNGKGSVSAMLEAVLVKNGKKVGSFHSPWLISMKDSICINGREMSEEAFATCVEELQMVEQWMDELPTGFEMLTAIAFLYFAKEECDLMIVECGMGGDTDATNVLSDSLLSIITNVQLDHQAWLGDSLLEIAGHKAGIIKKHGCVLIGEFDKDAEELVRGVAAFRHASLFQVKRKYFHLEKMELEGIHFSFGELTNLFVPLCGTYQIGNICIVLAAVLILKQSNFPELIEDDVRKGLRNVSWPGRFECLSRDPLVIYDGAHNVDGMKQAVETMREVLPNKRVMVLMSVMHDKKYEEMLAQLATKVDRLFAVEAGNPRALKKELLVEACQKKGIQAEAFDTVAEGFEAAKAASKDADCPCMILGSLYLYEDIIPFFRK